MSADFSADARGRLWLLRTTECLTSVDGHAVRTKHPEERRLTRVATAAAVGQKLTMEQPLPQDQLTEANHYGVEPKAAARGALGSHSLVRAARRRAREAVPDDGEVRMVVEADLLQGTPTVQIRDHVRSTAASKALGSTQLSGCPGDFCGGHALCPIPLCMAMPPPLFFSWFFFFELLHDAAFRSGPSSRSRAPTFGARGNRGGGQTTTSRGMWRWRRPRTRVGRRPCRRRRRRR
jgi:hypothetical protein